jgi:hypothetical protein
MFLTVGNIGWNQLTRQVMRTTIGLLVLVVVALCGLLWLSRPQVWPIPQGTLKAKKVMVDGQSYLMIDGEAMNKLGQIQSINLELDPVGKRLQVNRCMVRWSPLSRIRVNNQWPVFYPLDSLKPGRYSVVYATKEGEAAAGEFDVP